jgi:hypothetical protein
MSGADDALCPNGIPSGGEHFMAAPHALSIGTGRASAEWAGTKRPALAHSAHALCVASFQGASLCRWNTAGRFRNGLHEQVADGAVRRRLCGRSRSGGMGGASA